MLAQRIRNLSKVHSSILRNLFLIFFRQEKSTAIVNLANHARVTTAEVGNSQETGRLYPGFLLVNGDSIRESVIRP